MPNLTSSGLGSQPRHRQSDDDATSALGYTQPNERAENLQWCCVSNAFVENTAGGPVFLISDVRAQLGLKAPAWARLSRAQASEISSLSREPSEARARACSGSGQAM